MTEGGQGRTFVWFQLGHGRRRALVITSGVGRIVRLRQNGLGRRLVLRVVEGTDITKFERPGKIVIGRMASVVCGDVVRSAGGVTAASGGLKDGVGRDMAGVDSELSAVRTLFMFGLVEGRMMQRDWKMFVRRYVPCLVDSAARRVRSTGLVGLLVEFGEETLLAAEPGAVGAATTAASRRCGRSVGTGSG